MSSPRRLLAAAAVAVGALALLSWGGGLGGLVARVSPGVVLDTSHTQTHAGPAGGGAAQPVTVAPSGADPANARVVTSVSVQRAARAGRGYTIAARLVAKDRADLNGIDVAFYDIRPLLGTREMLIGSATTNGSGVAQLSYLPAEPGKHEIVARPVSWDQLQATEAHASFQADAVAPAAYVREHLPLERFSAPLPYAAALVLVGVWGLFAFIVLGSLYVIPRHTRRAPHLAHRARVL